MGESTPGFLSIGISGPLRGPQKCPFLFSEGLNLTGTLISGKFGDAFLGLFEIFWHWWAFDGHPLRIELALDAHYLSIERALLEFTLEAHCLSIQWAMTEHPRHWTCIWWVSHMHPKKIGHTSEEHRTHIWSNMHLSSMEDTSEEHWMRI